MFQDFVTVFNLAYCCHNSHFLAETDCRNPFQDSPPWFLHCHVIMDMILFVLQRNPEFLSILSQGLIKFEHALTKDLNQLMRKSF